MTIELDVQPAGGEVPGGASDVAADALLERIQALTSEIDEMASPAVRERADALVGSIVELYGEGLTRIVEEIAASGAADELRDALTADGMVASLLLIHDLYPVSLEDRVAEALDGVRPYLESHGGNVALLGISKGIATLRLEGSCKGCPASSATLELAIKQALDEHAPDLEGLVVEGIEGAAPTASDGELPILQIAGSGNGNGSGPASWEPVTGLEAIAEGGHARSEVGGVLLIVARVEGTLLAFRDFCPACEGGLARGGLDGGVLTCPSCRRTYDLPKAGRAVDGEGQLEPVPLLATDGGVRVAIGGV